jgi:hypothetical protein
VLTAYVRVNFLLKKILFLFFIVPGNAANRLDLIIISVIINFLTAQFYNLILGHQSSSVLYEDLWALILNPINDFINYLKINCPNDFCITQPDGCENNKKKVYFLDAADARPHSVHKIYVSVSPLP